MMLFDLNTEPGKYEYDPIAVALLMHSLNVEPSRMIFDDEASNQLCNHHCNEMPAHVAQAKEIREFYKNKYLMYSIKSVLNTSFRRELLVLLSKNKNTYITTELKQLMTLPRMYMEDKTLEDISQKCNVEPFNEFKVPRPNDTRSQLSLMGVHTKKTRRIGKSKDNKEYFCYWFEDENNRANLIEMDMDNPFRNIWRELVQHTITVVGTRTEHSRDQVNFYSWPTFEIVDK